MPPISLDPLRVEIKENWADAWELRPNVEPLNANIQAGGIGSFQFRLRYGRVKHPTQSAVSTQAHTQINRQWVRILRSPYSANDVLFMGRIESDTRQVFGAADGIQTFTAYDGANLLNKLPLNSSVVLQDAAAQTLGVPLPFNFDMNSKQKSGNRSSSLVDGGYVFVPKGDLWNVDQAINYLFDNFVPSDADAPTWSITGLTVNDDLDPTLFGGGETILSALNKILNRKTGYSFIILPNDTGYELKLFSMNAEASNVVFGTVTIPANTDTVSITNATNPEVELTIEESQVNRYGKIVVQGSRMIICRSFDMQNQELVKQWLSHPDLTDLLTEYGNSDDEKRGQEKFKSLWTQWVVNLDPVKWTGTNNPTLNSDGTLDTATAAAIPQFEPTLQTLPLRSGIDYLAGDLSSSIEGDFMRPLFFAESFRDVMVEFADMEIDGDVLVLPDRFGVRVATRLPHVLSGDYSIQSHTPTAFNTDKNVLTVAFESPQRIRREYESASFDDVDGTLVIDVEDAEYWWVAPNTLFSITDGNRDYNATALLLRDDGDKLDRIMAGAIVRYINPRGKAAGMAHGLFAWHLDIGKVITTDDPDIRSVLTNVSWMFENGYQTKFSSGFAK